MKIAFFDHPFHEKTKSSNFFLDIVNALGGVDVFYADFHNEKDTELLINKLCYQFDLLTSNSSCIYFAKSASQADCSNSNV